MNRTTIRHLVTGTVAAAAGDVTLLNLGPSAVIVASISATH